MAVRFSDEERQRYLDAFEASGRNYAEAARKLGVARSTMQYHINQAAKGQKKAMPGLATEIVKRSDTAKGFEVLPRRWVVERTFAWLGRCRRLAKDFENMSRNALAFLKLASIRLMLRRLCSN